MVQPSQKHLPSIYDILLHTTPTSNQLAPLTLQNQCKGPFLDHLKTVLAEKKFGAQLAEYEKVVEKLAVTQSPLIENEGFSLYQFFTCDSVVQLNCYFQKLFSQVKAEKAERALYIALYYDLVRCIGQRTYAFTQKDRAEQVLLGYLESEGISFHYSILMSAISALVADEMHAKPSYRDSVIATRVDPGVVRAFLELKLNALRKRIKNFIQQFFEPKSEYTLSRLYLFSRKDAPSFMQIYAMSHNGYCFENLYEITPKAHQRLASEVASKVTVADATTLYEAAIGAIDPQKPKYYCVNLDQDTLEIYPSAQKRQTVQPQPQAQVQAQAQVVSSLADILHEKSEDSFACRRIYQKVGHEICLSVIKVPELFDGLAAAFKASNGQWKFDFNAETITKVKEHLIQTILINIKTETRVRGAIFLDVLDYFQAYTADSLQGLEKARGAVSCANEINRRLTAKRAPCIPEEQQICHGVIEERAGDRISQIFVLAKMIELLHRAKFLERYLTQVAQEPKVVPFYFIAQGSVLILNAYYNGKTFSGLLNDKTGDSEKRLEVLVGKVAIVSQYSFKVASLTAMQLLLLQQKAAQPQTLDFLALSQNLGSLSQHILEGKCKRGRVAKDLQRESPFNQFDESNIWLQLMKHNLVFKI